jgi:hypothetical protein
MSSMRANIEAKRLVAQGFLDYLCASESQIHFCRTATSRQAPGRVLAVFSVTPNIANPKAPDLGSTSVPPLHHSACATHRPCVLALQRIGGPSRLRQPHQLPPFVPAISGFGCNPSNNGRSSYYFSKIAISCCTVSISVWLIRLAGFPPILMPATIP